MMDKSWNTASAKWTWKMFVLYCIHDESCVCAHNVGAIPASFAWLCLDSTWYGHMEYVTCMCDIYHDSVYVILVYRRVFKISVSNVSYVSNLYFSRAYAWHVYWHVIVSRVQNQRMYTLWWMNHEIGYVWSEHKKCSFCMECTTNHDGVMHDVCIWVCSSLIVSMFIMVVYVRYMLFVCYIYHDFISMISI